MLQQPKLSRSRVVALAAAIAAVVPLWSLGCGGSPGGPTSVASKPLTSTLAGTLVDTISGGPVGGATVTITGRPAATTNADGHWESTGAPLIGIAQNVTAESEGFLTHQTALAWSGADRRDVTLDAIPDRTPFSLEFYRQIVRDGYERPMVLQPLRRWTTAPGFYINVTNASTNETMDASEVAMIVQAIRDSLRRRRVPCVAVSPLVGGRAVKGPADRMLARLAGGTMPAHVASCYAGLIDALGFGSAHVVGASLGGMIGQHLAIEHPARIRSLQNHGRSVEEAMPGTRTAANLAGLKPEELSRGQVVTRPGLLQPTIAVDVRLRVVDSLSRALRHNLNVTFHCFTSEAPARLRLLEGDEALPGEETWAVRVHWQRGPEARCRPA